MENIVRDVFVKRKTIENPIPYTRGTNSIQLQFIFRDFKIPEGAEAKVYVQKPSGKAVYDSAGISGNTVTVDVTTQMFAELGGNYLQLRIEREGRVLVTFTQPVDVTPNYTEGDAAPSKNEAGFFGELKDAVDKANQAAKDIKEKADRGDFSSTVQIGEVTTVGPDTPASVENTGTEKDAVLNIGIPKGKAGVSLRMAGLWSVGTEYVNNGTYIDVVSYGGSSYGCMQSHTASNDTAPGTGGGTGYWQCIAERGKTGEIENIDTIPIDFQKAAERANIEPGDSIPTALGKLAKLYDDLSNKSAFFTVIDQLPVTEPDVLLSGKGVNDAFACQDISGQSLSDVTHSGWYKGNNIPEMSSLAIGIPADCWWYFYVGVDQDGIKNVMAHDNNDHFLMFALSGESILYQQRFLHEITKTYDSPDDVLDGNLFFSVNTPNYNVVDGANRVCGFQMGGGDWKSQMAFSYGTNLAFRARRDGSWGPWYKIKPIPLYVDAGKTPWLNLPANGNAGYTVNFNITFYKIPYVFVTVCSSTGTWGYVTTAVSDLSMTGCYLSIHNLENVARNGHLYLTWVAFSPDYFI